MSDPNLPADPLAGASRDDILSALFASMVLQQTQMAMMFLGKVPHPESGQTHTDLDAARMFIDQMEMLEVKTKGNLTKQEESLLRQSLASVRMAFVEAVEKPAAAAAQQAEPAKSEASSAPTGGSGPAAPAPGASTASDEAESRKKFTKKY